MNIQYLIQILQNKITILNTAKSQAVNVGDLVQINSIDKELLDTQNTFSQLTLLADIAQAAENANFTTAEVVANGLDSVQNIPPSIQGPSAGAVINGYDVSAYATDPLYEDKIRAILSKLPVFQVVGEIDTYIKDVAPETPLTGEMIYKASHQYGVDLYLLLAIMQNDSSLGTLGVGARTNNPGNVGNTGSAERMYASWQEGVDAVADWLNRHRVVTPTADPAPVVIPGTTTSDTTAPSPVSVDNSNANASASANTTPAISPVNATNTVSDNVATVASSSNTILPTTPVVAATSTSTFVIPTANATTTPIVNPANPAVASGTDSGVPPVWPITGSSTPQIDNSPFSTTTDSTTTDSAATSTAQTGAATVPAGGGEAGTSTPPTIDFQSTTTPEFVDPASATSTPTVSKGGVVRRKLVVTSKPAPKGRRV